MAFVQGTLILLARDKDQFAQGGQARAQETQHVDEQRRGEMMMMVVVGAALGLIGPEQGVVEGDAGDAGQLGRVAEAQDGAQLGLGGHEAGARAKVEDVGVEVEEDAAGLVGDAEGGLVALAEGLSTRLATGVEVGWNRGGRGAAVRRGQIGRGAAADGDDAWARQVHSPYFPAKFRRKTGKEVLGDIWSVAGRKGGMNESVVAVLSACLLTKVLLFSASRACLCAMVSCQ